MQELVIALAATMLALVAAAWLAHRLRLPTALGYLAVGLVASPAIRSTPTLPPEPFHAVAEVAVLVLVFFIGLELNLDRLLKTLRSTAFAAAFNILIPGLFAAAAANALGWSLQHAIVLGICVSVSSTIFGERLAATRGFPGAARQRLLGILVGEDVAAVALLAIIVVMGQGGGEAVYWTLGKLLFLLPLILAVAVVVVPRVLDAAARAHQTELLVLATGAVILGFALLGLGVGSLELGALAAGVACAEAASRYSVRHAFEGVRALALAAFFLASGLAVDIGQVVSNAPTVLLVAAVFLAGKLIVNVPSAMAAGFGVDPSWRIGAGLATIGEFSLILAVAAERAGVAHPALTTTVVGALLVSLVTAPATLKLAPWVAKTATRTPSDVRRPALLLLNALRSKAPETAKAAKGEARRLWANLLPLVFILVLAALIADDVGHRVPAPDDVGLAVSWGLALAASAPFAGRAYQSYRRMVTQRLRPTASGLPSRLADAIAAATAALLMVPLIFLFPRAGPAIAGSVALALLLGFATWRQLVRLQRTFETTMARVLGEATPQATQLDRLIESYQWGVQIVAVPLPWDSPVARSTVKDARIDDLTGAELVMVKRGNEEFVSPPGDFRLRGGDTLVLMGEPYQIKRAEAIIVAGEVIRIDALSRTAAIEDIVVPAAGARTGTAFADLSAESGVIVVGVQRQGENWPRRPEAGMAVRQGDVLILLGTPLQLERARKIVQSGEAPA